MAGVLLERSTVKLPARGIVLAPRLPERPRVHTGNPFTTHGDVVAECQNCLEAGGKRYHVSGERNEVKKALDLHHRLFHSQEIGVVLLNQPRQ